MDTYQSLLRALGSSLDEEPSCRITLVETSDGFLVRLQRALHHLDPQIVQFTREELRKKFEDLVRLRRWPNRAHHQGIWTTLPNGHQDFFRALGYELDQVHARCILIDEVEDGIVVTYSYPDDKSSGAWGKRLVKLDLKEIEHILNTAFERRKKVQT